jgi:hypothetical protein
MGKADVDLDLIAQLEADSGRAWPGCDAGKALASLDDKTAATIEAALARIDITHEAIARVISDRSGMHVAGGTVGRHRNGKCRCGR